MNKLKYIAYKFAFGALLRVPDAFYAALFALVFPIYKALHQKRAYGRVVNHLALAREYAKQDPGRFGNALQGVTPEDMFRGIYWNALDSYRGLARFASVTRRIVYENEEIIREAVKQGPIAGISIHQGSFELMHRALCRYSEHVHLITDSVGDEAFRKNLEDLRSDPHLTEYHPEETGRLIRDLFKTKGILAMVYDQGRNTKGNTVELFGRPTTLYLRLLQKVNEMGAGIVTFRTWTERKRIIIHFETYYPPKYGEIQLVTDIARETERWIAEHPDQWSWNYHGNFLNLSPRL